MLGGSITRTPRRRCGIVRRLGPVLAALALSFAPWPAWSNGGAAVHTIDFTEPAKGAAGGWLREQGFQLRMSAQDLSPRFTERGLVISTERAITGLFAKELRLTGAERVRVTWGVDRYPEGANWEEGIYRVPIAIMISFGEKEIASGSLFVPNVPYFISLFLSKNAEPGKAYTANYYHKGGRYFCEPCSPPAGEAVTATFDLSETFKRTFDQEEVPPITGFSFQMNTKDTRGGAQAFIERVEFLGPS